MAYNCTPPTNEANNKNKTEAKTPNTIENKLTTTTKIRKSINKYSEQQLREKIPNVVLKIIIYGNTLYIIW